MAAQTGSSGRSASRRESTELRVLVVDGGGLPLHEAVDAMRAAGLRVAVERVLADEPWCIVRGWAQQQEPPDVVIVIHRAGTMGHLIGQIQTAERFLGHIPLVVVAPRDDQDLLRRYQELGARHVLTGGEVDRLGEVVRQALGETPRPATLRHHRVGTDENRSDRLRQSAVLQAAAELKSKLWRISDRMWIKDGDLRLLYANDAFARDLHTTADDMVGLTDCELFGDELGKQFRRRDRRVMADGDPVKERGPREGTMVCKIPITDEAGKAVALVLARTWATDERQRIEEALYTLADVVVSSTDAIVVLDSDGTIRSCNPAAAAIYGSGEEEMAGRDIVEIAAPGHREALLSDVQRAVEDYEIRRREAVHLTGDGGTVDVSVAVSPVVGPWGELTAVSLVARDIFEQVRARRALRASEERFRLMAEAAFDGMSIVELDAESGRQQLVFCNERYVEMSGRTERKLRQARDLRTLRARGPELESVEALHMLREEYADPAYWQECEQRLAEGLPVMEIGSWNRPDGQENYHERSCVCVPLNGNRYLFSVDRDVTEALRREQELKETLEELALSHNELERLGYGTEGRPETKEPHQAEIEEVARQVRLDPVGDFDFRAAAESLHLSYGHFRALFRQYMDRPPHDYLLLWRMRKAARALRDPDRLVKSVAHEVGYSDPDQFYKLFKKKIGLSPTDYRKALRRTQHARP
ncbi:MAG: PAS domain S-box protein [Candidatus Brocadiia bacterium]